MALGSDVTGAGRFSTRPLYLQVQDALAERIATGEWKPNVALPNEADLAREFGVSPGTIRKALEMMESMRLLTRRQGRGTFVNDQASDELAVRYCNIRTIDGERVSGEVNVLAFLEVPASPEERRRLRLRSDDRVWRVQRLRLHEGVPFMVEQVAMPAALFPGLGERKRLPQHIVTLAQHYRVLLGKAEERISIGAALSGVAESLGLAHGSPILVLDRLVHTLEGRPAEWRIGHARFDHKYYLAEIR
jgi:GntR family transcriptional regulator